MLDVKGKVHGRSEDATEISNGGRRIGLSFTQDQTVIISASN